MISCITLYEALFVYADDNNKKRIAKSVINAIDFVVKEKSYKTGTAEYGGDVIKEYNLDKQKKALFDEKREIYDTFLYPDKKKETPQKKSVSEQINRVFEVQGKQYQTKDVFLILLISIVGFILPPAGIIILWIFGKHFQKKNKIITTIALVIWFMILISIYYFAFDIREI